MDPNQEMLQSFFGPQEEEEVTNTVSGNNGIDPDQLAAAERYIQGGIEDVYRKKMQAIFGGKGKKATAKKVLLTLLEGAAGFTGTPGIGARAYEGAKEEYKAKAPLLNRDILSARMAQRQEDADTRRLQLKALEYKQKFPLMSKQIDKITSEIGKNNALAEKYLEEIPLIHARTENTQANTELTGAKRDYVGTTPAMQEAMAVLGLSRKDMKGQDYLSGMTKASLAKAAPSLLNAAQDKSSTTSYTRELPFQDPLTGKTEYKQIDKTSTTSKPGNRSGINALQAILGNEDILNPLKIKEAPPEEKKTSTIKAYEALVPSSPPPSTPGRGTRIIAEGYSPKQAERIRGIWDKARATRTMAFTVFDALDGTLARGVGPIAGTDWANKAREWLNMKDTGEVLAQANVMKNQMQAILEQSGKAINLEELRRLGLVEPTREDNNRNLLIKTIASALIAEDVRVRSSLPSDIQKELYSSSPLLIKKRVEAIMSRIENQRSKVDPKTGRKMDPKLSQLITPWDLSGASLYPDLVKRGLIGADGEVSPEDRKQLEVDKTYGIRDRTQRK